MYEICQLSEPVIETDNIEQLLETLPNCNGHISIKYRSQIGMKQQLFLTISSNNRITETYTGTCISNSEISHILSK
ncbi:hypothetical protein [Photobacterium sp. GB-72]|uniref:hypothetical protein n=1 Tax=Photobacterium sp. GB-72 TaxID=2022105 RepID=UPI0011B28118|nr:hypothetical protein [Photobacterium sp. GB-72]